MSLTRWLLAVALFHLGLTAALLAAPVPGPPTQHYFIRAWRNHDGLPESAINAVLQTRDGYLWLGTYNGLVRFDGARFVVFQPGNTPGLPSGRITCLFEDASGTLWIGHETGRLSRYADGTFSPANLPAAWSGGKLSGLAPDAAGELWVANERGLVARVRDGLVLSPTPLVAADANVVTLASGPQGRLWVARGGAVSAIDQGRLVPLSTGATGSQAYVEGVAASQTGGFWVVSQGRVRLWQGQTAVRDLGPRPWGEASLTALLELRSGTLVAGTLQDGVYLLRTNGEALHVSRANGLSHNWVRCLFEDREDNLWIGTRNGLNTLREGKVATVIVLDDWQDREVTAVAAGTDGSLWAGTEGAGLYHWNGEQWSNLGTTQGLAKPFMESLLSDPTGKLWVGTWESGLYCGQAEHFTRVAGLETVTAPVTALVPGANGELWLGTGTGLGRYSDGKTTWYDQRMGLALPDVRAIARGHDGAVWFGMLGGGLGCLKDGGLRQFRQADGLASDFVQCLHEDADGVLWIGTSGSGLSRLKNGKFAQVGTPQGLPDGIICHIEEDGAGNFWMSSHAGIFRVPKLELDRCAEGQISAIHCLVYGLGDGLPALECSGGRQSAGCKSADGRLWFPTIKGLVVVDPADVKANQLPPPVCIEELLVDGKAHLPGRSTGELELPRGSRQVEVRYTGLSFVAPEKVRFKYRLEGLENEWNEAGTRRSVTYSYLPPGRYTFHVSACNADGVWSAADARVNFSVLPRFWQTWWFQALAILATLLAVGGGVWWTMRRQMRRKFERLERQRAIERERARIAQDIHDDIGASLTRITLLSQSVRKKLTAPDQAAPELERIYGTARDLTRAMDEIVWAVNPRHDTLDSLADYLARFANDFLGAAGINCQLELPLQLPLCPLTTEVRHNLFLAFKEAVHNAVKHSGATEVRIALELSKSAFALVVTDNGCGFTPSAPTTPSPGQENRLACGNGLLGMQRRLQEIGGRFTLHSAPGQGTRVTFSVPLTAPVI